MKELVVVRNVVDLALAVYHGGNDFRVRTSGWSTFQLREKVTRDTHSHVRRLPACLQTIRPSTVLLRERKCMYDTHTLGRPFP